MPALSFGLKSNKPPSKSTSAGHKRKAVFSAEPEDDDQNDAFSNLSKPSATTPKLKFTPITDGGSNGEVASSGLRPRKSPKLSASAKPQGNNGGTNYSNLSALRTAMLHDEQASKLDASVYDYDAVYETFHAVPDTKTANNEAAGPKYMTSLMTSAEVRKRDQLRAREKLLQKERENEGDEFADKEKFVTGAYKKAQEEMRLVEEEEKRKEKEEEEQRRKGGGMEAFNKSLLKKEEERQKMIEKATEEARQRRERGEDKKDEEELEDDDENKLATDLNKQGARIAINDEGEVLDKRQLLSAGLNVAPNKKAEVIQTKQSVSDKSQQRQSSTRVSDARASQRDRQTKMIERQIEEMARKQQEAEEAERMEAEEKSKSKITEDAKSNARERFLQRKREREEEGRKKSTTG